MKLTYGSTPLSPLEIVELCLTIFCIIVAFAWPSIGKTWFSRVEQALRVTAQRTWLCAAIVALLPISLRVLLLPVYGVPTPFAKDEFAYLLQADTFASARLTNPSPPCPEFFASTFILVNPTYASEYQAAQGLMLAIGQKLAGSPWASVVASMGLFCAVLYWALLAWLPSVWAFIGAGLMGIEVGVLSYWMNSYLGGTVAGIGGALALGALLRLREHHRPRYSLIMAIGLMIVLNNRPLEGVLLSIISAGVLLYWCFVTRQLSWAALLRRILPPVTLVFAIGIAFIAYYNHRVTGHAAEFPYLLYRQQYGVPQGFLWQPAMKVSTPMPVDIKAEYDVQLRTHERGRSPAGLARLTAIKVRRIWKFYVDVPLTVVLVFLPFIWREAHMKLAFIVLLIIVGLDNMTFFEYYPHYSAPVAVLIVLAVVQCIRHMRATGRAGLFLSRSLPIVCAIGLMIPMSGRFLEPSVGARIIKLWQREFAYPQTRARLVKSLDKRPGRQIVLVRYSTLPDNSAAYTVLKLKLLREVTGWVYNSADLSAAKVVWARELDPESNRELLKHFPDRKAWLAEPEQDPPRLRLYADAASLQYGPRGPHVRDEPTVHAPTE
jgi:hypothetical protein